MSAVKLTIHETGTGTCSLTGKEGPGLTVSFEDGTLSNSFLTWKAFQQILGMKAGQKKADPPKPAPPPTPTALPVNGPVPVAEAKK